MDNVNPQQPSIPPDLSGWFLIVTESGESWIGAGVDHETPDVREIVLKPAYRYHAQLVMTPQGPGVVRQLMRVEISCGEPDLEVDVVVVRAAAIQELVKLPERRKRDLVKQLEGAEEDRLAVRAQQSGLVVAGGRRKS